MDSTLVSLPLSGRRIRDRRNRLEQREDRQGRASLVRQAAVSHHGDTPALQFRQQGQPPGREKTGRTR
jgi:hypothetical protein